MLIINEVMQKYGETTF